MQNTYKKMHAKINIKLI